RRGTGGGTDGERCVPWGMELHHQPQRITVQVIIAQFLRPPDLTASTGGVRAVRHDSIAPVGQSYPRMSLGWRMPWAGSSALTRASPSRPAAGTSPMRGAPQRILPL